MSHAVRITRDEIAVAPEFRGLESLADPEARTGGARIELIRAGDGSTRLGACYQQVPIRLMPPFVFDAEPAALLYLINLTAGLMDGDAHLVEITARSGTRVVVTGQSANRVHPALASYATQQYNVRVEDDACLVVLPAPTIPYQGCRFYQRARVQLAPGARLIWGDIWLPGRYERGALSERFQFEQIIQDMAAYRAGRLVYRDRFRWDGPWTPEDVDWHVGGQLASASLFVAGPLPDSLPPSSPAVQRAVFRLDSGESCLRWCGDPGLVTAELVAVAMGVAGGWTGAAPWLLGSSELAPNHWFSLPAALDGDASADSIAEPPHDPTPQLR
jgi:urease accessory protein